MDAELQRGRKTTTIELQGSELMKNYDTELALVAGLMQDNARIMEVDLLAEEFAYEEPRSIYIAIQELTHQRIPADIITVAEYMDARHGGAHWFNRIGHYVANVTCTNARIYADSIRASATKRRAVEIAQALLEGANDGQPAVDVAIGALMEIGRSTRKYEYTIKETLRAAVDDIERSMELGDMPGLPSGIEALDGLTGGFHDTDFIVIGARPAMGKELTMDSLVLLSNGRFKPMKDIEMNDDVASVDGRASKVVGVYPQGVKPVYKITFSDGRSVDAGLDHQWEVMYRGWSDPRVLTTSQLIHKLKCKRYSNRIYIPNHTADFGEDVDINIDPYLLGVLLGDGSFAGQGVKLTTSHSHIIDKIKAKLMGCSLKSAGGIDYRISSRPGSKNKLLDEIRNLGLGGALSHQKFIPANYLSATKETRLEIMRGLVDTDGTVEKHGSMTYTSTSKRLASDFQALARSLGSYASMTSRVTKYTYLGEKKEGKRSYTVCISCAHYGDFVTLPKKKDRILHGKSSRNLNIKTIEYIGDFDCQCISVDHPRSLYMSNDYTVTHNTAFMLNCALGANACVGIMSTEQGYSQLGTRLIAIDGKVSISRMRRAQQLDDSDFARITGSSNRMMDGEIYINDMPSPTLADIARQARQWKFRKNIKALYIDYIQRIKVTGSAPRHEQIGDIAMGLKELARELNIPVIALAQVNRNVEQRADRRPGMADLKDSGGIEQEADMVMTLYRDEVYNQDTQDKGMIEILIAKNRHGETGRLRAAWMGEYLKVGTLENRY
jgi:replicative DNA helicase